MSAMAELQQIIPLTHSVQIDTDVKKNRGRPKGSVKFTVEERKRRACEASKKCYYENYEYRSLQKKLYYQRKKEEKKIDSERSN